MKPFSLSAAAREFGLSPSTLSKAIEDGRLRAERNPEAWGSEAKYRITRKEMRRYMAHRLRPVVVQRHTLLWRRCKAYEARIAELESELAGYRSQEQFEALQQRINWSDFDTAQAQVTRAERELFEASPAYQRYQQMREDCERRGTGDWRLKRGDWRTP